MFSGHFVKLNLELSGSVNPENHLICLHLSFCHKVAWYSCCTHRVDGKDSSALGSQMLLVAHSRAQWLLSLERTESYSYQSADSIHNLCFENFLIFLVLFNSKLFLELEIYYLNQLAVFVFKALSFMSFITELF